MALTLGKTLFPLVVAITMATTSNGLTIINGITVRQIRILGRVTCDIPPPPPVPEAAPILNGTNVALRCREEAQDLAAAVADLNGFFELVLDNTLQTLFFDPSECFVVVRLPITRCRIYPPTGVLIATLDAVSFFQPLFTIAVITAGPLSLVT